MIRGRSSRPTGGRVLVAALFLGCAQIAGLSGHGPASDGAASTVGLDGGTDAGGGGAGGGAGAGDGPAAGPMCVQPPSTCPAGMGDCSGHGCVDSLSGNADNCGACGHDCHGGECQDSECLPLILANDQHFDMTTAVAVSARGVYWGTIDGNLIRMPLNGPPERTTVVTGEGAIKHVAVDDQFAYLMTDGGHCTAGWCIRRISLVPGPLPTTLVDIDSYSGGLIADAHAIYWYQTGGFIRRLDTHAADAKPIDLASNQGRDANLNLALDADYIYWASNVNSEATIKRVRIDGTGGAPQHLAGGLKGANAVAVDDANVYWGDTVTHQIQRIAKDGTGPITTLATDSADFSPFGVAVDELNVYWGGGGGTQGIRKVRKCGGPLRPVPSNGTVFGVTVFAGNVYWNDTSTRVYMVAQ